MTIIYEFIRRLRLHGYVRLDLTCFRGLGNSGGQFSFASLYVFASLFVIFRRSRRASVRGIILHPTVLNNSIALRVKHRPRLESYFDGLIWISWAS